MDSETEFKATPADIARITRTALTALAETHIIITKEELSEIVDEAVQATMTDMWEMTLDAYDKATAELAEVLPPERHKGFELGGKMLHRMRAVISGTYAEVFSANHAENSPK